MSRAGGSGQILGYEMFAPDVVHFSVIVFLPKVVASPATDVAGDRPSLAALPLR
jgi:hypothetical protein